MEELIKQLMGQMNNRFDKLEQDIEGVKQEIINNQTENRSYFKHIETKLEQHNAHLSLFLMN